MPRRGQMARRMTRATRLRRNRISTVVRWLVSWRAETIIRMKEAMDAAIHADARRAGRPLARVAGIAFYRLSVLWHITTPVWQATNDIPPVIWWNNLERILLAVDDLGC